MDFDSISKWLSDNYILVFVVLPGVIAHVMPHLSPEWQARLGRFGVLLNAISGNYKNAKNSPKIQAVEQIVAAASSPEAVADSSAAAAAAKKTAADILAEQDAKRAAKPAGQ